MPHVHVRRAHLLLGCPVLVSFLAASCTLDRTGVNGEGGSQGTSASTSGTSSSEASATGVTASVGSGPVGGVGGGGGTDSSGGVGGSGAGGASQQGSGSVAASTSGAGSTCGNGGEAEPDEECDDGGLIPGDGCGATCLAEHPDTCPGTPVPMDAGVLVVTASTVGADDTLRDTQGAGPCPDGTYFGPDLIYAVTPTVSGTLTVQLDADYPDHFLVLRTSCPSSASDVLDCDYDSDRHDVDEVETSVEAGETYFVVVDSYGESSGDFSLRIVLVASN